MTDVKLLRCNRKNFVYLPLNIAAKPFSTPKNGFVFFLPLNDSLSNYLSDCLSNSAYAQAPNVRALRGILFFANQVFLFF